MKEQSLAGLTCVELKTVKLVAKGLKNQEIADKMGNTENTIKNRLRVIYDKLGFYTRLEVALWWVKTDWDAKRAK